ncbi:ABC transporter permease [Agromyces archimandritae]|uniref:Transport permease protein n=1 Tax=Agromyces archimandritae TaxID=2781962 RepID=A0A975FK83_9MICO|nr:ABC transporter permease [Agromyces archimandritae]QTX04068.1 ABC transporter permease [Agromyces archimandritae]
MSTRTALSRVMFTADLRDFATLFFTFAFPAGLLIALVTAFGSLPSPHGGDSVNEVSSNVIAFGTAFVGIFAGASHIAAWRENGMMRVLRSAPVTPAMILGAQAGVGSLWAVLQSVLLVGIAVTPWLGMTLAGTAPLALVPIAAGFVLFFCLGVLLANAVPSTTAVTMLSMIIVIPLGFAGGAMMPLEFMPAWVQDLAPFTPVHHMREAITFTLTGLGEWATSGLGLAYLVGAGAVLFLAGRATMRWM